MALFPGSPRWAGARRELLDFMVQGKINRSRHTDHLAGRHSIRTNQCLPPPSPIFLQAGCPSCRPTNSIKALSTLQERYSNMTSILLSSYSAVRNQRLQLQTENITSSSVRGTMLPSVKSSVMCDVSNIRAIRVIHTSKKPDLISISWSSWHNNCWNSA